MSHTASNCIHHYGEYPRQKFAKKQRYLLFKEIYQREIISPQWDISKASDK